MKCPYCGAELQEGAAFCLYCMRSLEKKPDIIPRPLKKRRWLLWLGLAGATVLLVILGLLLGHCQAEEGEESGAPSGSQTQPSTTVQTQPQSTEPEAPKEPIITYEQFTYAAIYAESELWSPFSSSVHETGEGWVKYWTPIRLEGVQMNLYFLDDGAQIYAILSGLTEADLENGRIIACALMDMVYGASGTDCEAAYLTEVRLQQLEPVEQGRSLAERLDFGDPRADQIDAGTACRVTGRKVNLEAEYYGYPDTYLICELRQRTWEGETYYDIFLFFGQE